MSNKYNEKDEFWEITFQVPKNQEAYTGEFQKRMAGKILDLFKESCNIKVIPCRIVKSKPVLEVSKDSHNYTIFNHKQESQIIEEKSFSDLQNTNTGKGSRVD